MDHLHLSHDKLSVEQITDLVADDSCGAISVFAGTTRDNFEGKKVTCLEYESYEAMALKEMKNICEETRKKWPDIHHIALYHRLGIVPIREASVVIAASSPHRVEAIAAVSHMIDQLKASVPIWKKEVYQTGPPVWKENKECSPKRDTKMEQDEDNVDKNLVQLNVSSDEIQKRIQSFIDRKREQVNINNILDFIPKQMDATDGIEDSETCARVRTLYIKRSDSKGHVKIRKVHNEWGPQTMKHSIKTDNGNDAGLSAAIAERVGDVEKFVNVTPVSRDIYERLKVMEDKIAQLQALSPEYAQFWRHDKEADVKTEKEFDFMFSAEDIAKKIAQLER